MEQISNISSVAIIYRKSNPNQVFIERKDYTHPLILVRGGLCFIGGNWVGVAAINDLGPRDTVLREMIEELMLKAKNVNTQELVDLGLANSIENYITQISHTEIEEADQIILDEIITAIKNELTPFGSYLNTVTREAILTADPTSTRDGFTTLSCYFEVGLDEENWEKLTYLQEKYSNLSNESESTILSLEEIIEQNLSGAFCHEQVLRDFFLSKGLTDAHNMRIIPDQTSVYVDPPLATYTEYLEIYDIAKMPKIKQ